MAKLAPIAKTVFLCDELVRDDEKNKTSVLNMFDTVRPDEASPLQLGRLCVFSELSDGFGDLLFWIEAVRLDTLAPVFRTVPRTFRFADRLANVQILFRLEDLRFPKIGDYLIRLYCEKEMVGDRVLHLRP